MAKIAASLGLEINDLLPIAEALQRLEFADLKGATESSSSCRII
jgi:hypothetical protein